MSYVLQERQLCELLGLRWAPVAVAYRASAPEGVPRVPVAGPSGCSYWKRAAAGEVFYTEAADHYHCPIGAYTHNIALPKAQRDELQSLVGTMVGLEYLRPEELPRIPRRAGPFRVAIYAPLGRTPVAPDVVLLRGNACQMMLLTEAAGLASIGAVPSGRKQGRGAAAGRGTSLPFLTGGLMGRPTCAALPAALQAGQPVASLGCIGNRVYTDLTDDELYMVVPGSQLTLLVEKLETIVHANRELEAFHRARLK